MTLFTMDVKDTFRFSDNMIAFVGPVQSQAKFIGPGECEIVVGDKVKASIRIDGEMIPKRKKDAHGETSSYRSVSTSQKIDLEALGINTSGFVLRSKT